MAPSEEKAGPRSKKKAILDAAVDNFGSVGYEQTKWATVAGEVGIGQTALYHYFESKAHCLLTIMSTELDRRRERFAVAVEVAPDAESALRAAIASVYDVTEREALQARILLHHVHMLVTPRSSEREENERVRARELTGVVERDWADLLARGMESGQFPRRDEEEEGRFMLGLINSVWNWYRPNGDLPLAEVAESVREACLRLVH